MTIVDCHYDIVNSQNDKIKQSFKGCSLVSMTYWIVTWTSLECWHGKWPVKKTKFGMLALQMACKENKGKAGIHFVLIH